MTRLQPKGSSTLTLSQIIAEAQLWNQLKQSNIITKKPKICYKHYFNLTELRFSSYPSGFKVYQISQLELKWILTIQKEMILAPKIYSNINILHNPNAQLNENRNFYRQKLRFSPLSKVVFDEETETASEETLLWHTRKTKMRDLQLWGNIINGKMDQL